VLGKQSRKKTGGDRGTEEKSLRSRVEPRNCWRQKPKGKEKNAANGHPYQKGYQGGKKKPDLRPGVEKGAKKEEFEKEKRGTVILDGSAQGWGRGGPFSLKKKRAEKKSPSENPDPPPINFELEKGTIPVKQEKGSSRKERSNISVATSQSQRGETRKKFPGPVRTKTRHI